MTVPQDTRIAFQVSVDDLAEFEQWVECAAVRIKKTADGLKLQLAATLDAITDPSICSTCDGEGEIRSNPAWPDPQGEVSDRCGACDGSGRSEF
jgi:DnaJ-class molecular chaperone